MTTNYMKLLGGKESELAIKVLDYLDGNQIEHIEKNLDHPNTGRKDWRQRGIVPRFRNITKMIIEKSGLLFNDKAPVLSVIENGIQDDAATAALYKMLEAIEWVELFSNLDTVTRALQTGLLLVEWDSTVSLPMISILHRGNSQIIVGANNKLEAVIYKTGERNDDSPNEVHTMRVYTKDQIIDVECDHKGDETVVGIMENPLGIVPVAVFYDTSVPRCDFWNKVPEDVMQINDIYNLHIIDSEYAASWAKLKTLFTNCVIGESVVGGGSVQEVYGQPLPHYSNGDMGVIGGPSRTVSISSVGGEAPFVEYIGPDVDLEPIDTMINKWVHDFAADWSVNVRMAGTGTADSGFKLIVEEMPNLELRKKRQRAFEAGIKRFYNVLKVVTNFMQPGTFPEDSTLVVTFIAPHLPIDEKVQEEVWALRIAQGRASRIDYFMQVAGMTKDEALVKIAEIDEQRAAPVAAQPSSVKSTQTRAIGVTVTQNG